MKTDFLFYDLFQSSPKVVLELLGTPSPERGLYSFVSQEVKETRFQIDGILLPHHRRPDLPVYFLEVQGYLQKKGDSFYHAFFAEVNLYLNDYRPTTGGASSSSPSGALTPGYRSTIRTMRTVSGCSGFT